MPNTKAIALREKLMKQFSETELEALCQDVNGRVVADGKQLDNEITLELVGGRNKLALVLNLIQYVDRRGWLPYLEAAIAATEQGDNGADTNNSQEREPISPLTDTLIDLTKWPRAKLQKLLEEAIDSNDLETICSATPALSRARLRFSAGMGYDQKIVQVLDFAEQQEETETLLKAVRRLNPKKFQRIQSEP